MLSPIERISVKVLDDAALSCSLSLWRLKAKKIVFTNGCFDILHLGHVNYLAEAAALGDILIVGLNSDESVRRLKGPARPVIDQQSRSMVLASLMMVDAVYIFETDTPYDLIKLVRPDVLVKGGDYKAEDVVGYDLVKARGGEVVILPFIEGYSTTVIAEKISCRE